MTPECLASLGLGLTAAFLMVVTYRDLKRTPNGPVRTATRHLLHAARMRARSLVA